MRLIFLFFILGLTGASIAQTNFEHAIEYRQKLGFLAAHRGVMAHMPKNPAWAGELSYVLRSRGHKAYQRAYNYPTFGGTLFYGQVGNQEILGNYLGAYGYTELPMISFRNYRMDFKFGLGLGYNNHPYDPIKNPLNVAISTRINGLMCLAIKSTYQYKKNAFNIGLDITHFSNAAWKVPNFGINMPFVSIGYARTIIPVDKMKFDPYEGEARIPMNLAYKRWYYSVTAILSGKQMMPIGGRRYPVYALNLSGKHFFGHKAGLELALDLISKQAIMDYQPYISKSQLDILQVGAYAAYLVPLDRFHFVFGMGAYLRDKFSPEDPMYHRIGARYYLKNGLLLNLTLKTHWARADYLEYGIGYTFNYRAK